MSGIIPEEFIADLRHRTDIVEVIKDYVRLKKQGRNYIGHCPFHAEKTPSFVVSPDKQIYHCFGCGKGGNIYTFLMEKNALSFPDAVSLLARRLGVAMPSSAGAAGKSKEAVLRKRYYAVNELASRCFHRQLFENTGRTALKYLKERGLRQEAIEHFLLGYAPPEWDRLSRFLLAEGIKEEELLLLGLAVKSARGNLVDRFYNRIIFPIADDRGRIVGFGGRVLDGSNPKYLNSPETPLYIKGKHLYGLHLAKGSIRNNDYSVVMEGYMDCITAHQNGLTNAVAALGTALTQEQARQVMRYSYNVYICFDADAAGQNAALRGLDVLQRQGCNVYVITVPGAKDPDEYIKNEGGENFKTLVGQAETLLEYKLARFSAGENTQSVAGKIKVVQALIPDILSIKSPVARQAFVQIISERLVLPETAVYAEIKNAMHRKEEKEKVTEAAKQKERGQSRPALTATEKAQRFIMRTVLENPDNLPEVEESGGIELFGNKLLKEIYRVYYVIRQSGHNIKANDIIHLLDSVEQQEMVTEILLEDELVVEEGEKAFRDCLRLLKLEYINRMIIENSELMSECEKSGEVSKSLEIMAKIQRLVQEKQNLSIALRKGGIVF